MSDPQLHRQLQDEATSMQAFDVIFERLFTGLCYFAHGIVGEQEQAKDIVLDSFEKLWSKKREFESYNHIRSFMVTVVRNACFNYIRSRNIKAKHADEYLHKLPPSENDIEKLIDEAEIIRELYAEIEKLPEKCKEVFKLTYLEGIDRKQIAQMLGISENTVRNHNARAMELLRTAFGERKFIIAWLLLVYAIIKN